MEYIFDEAIRAERFVNISDVNCPPSEGGAWLPYDDEGILKRDVELIKDGKLVGLLHSKKTAAMLNQEPTGNGRASTCFDLQKPRQVNIILKPGIWSKEGLINELKEGLLISEGFKGIWDVEGNFLVKSLYARLIKNGKLTDRFFSPVDIAGNSLEVLRNIYGISNKSEMTLDFYDGCVKADQTLIVGHSAPYIGIKEMEVKTEDFERFDFITEYKRRFKVEKTF